MKPKLSRSMTIAQFDNGYWYATELKAFAVSIGIQSAGKLRKDELEAAIKQFLRTGETQQRKPLPKSRMKDVQRGLSLDLPVIAYTNDSETKDFLEREAAKLAPGYKRKSGARYRINRWREEQLARGVRITYGDVVREYARLSEGAKPFAQIPHVRYVNFLSDFFAAEKDATREEAIRAWKKLKTMDIPKNYRSWVRVQKKKR